MKFHEPIEGHELTQSPLIDHAFRKLKGIEQVIEIGTWRGGFTIFLRLFFNVEVHSFDIHDYGYNFPPGITFYCRDALEPGSIKIITDLLKNKKTLLLCDGGHKVNEFTMYGKFLKKGDLIGAHDYGKTKEYFDSEIKDKFWTTSHEVDWPMLKDYCEAHGLKPIHEDTFDKVVWLICEKQ